MKALTSGCVILTALLAGMALAGPADDDLNVVKRAVLAPVQQPNALRSQASAPKAKPQWLRVRVVDKGTRKSKVSVNLPLSLAHAVGDVVPLDWDCHHGERCHLKVSEILATLESGAGLVEIDADDAMVKVWVE